MIRRPVLAAFAIALTGCAAPTTTTTQLPTGTQRPAVTTPAPRPTTTLANAPIPTGCQPAPSGVVATISAAFSDPSNTLADTFAVSAPGGLVYVGANIMQGTTKVSSADVWVTQRGSVYSLSGDARRRTTLPDGRKVLNASAGDDFGTQVQDCVTTTERARNRSGGR
ncbi:hypothetical protein [Nocardia sp. R7R-8]|uniref:hypothetical protein n=1 Tax=Nocardia sp. R7R-8 TaxID=3459304 RepID=UPI00403DE56D